MRGKYRITVQNKRIKYDFEIRRNITVIRGDSATGKTALVEMIHEYYENGSDSGIELQCNKVCATLEGRSWKIQLNELQDCIIFIDEGNNFVVSKEFAAAIQQTDNYYVIVTREGLPALPYSVEEIYGIRDSGKYGHLKQTYNELYHIYGKSVLAGNIKPDIVMTEDSNSGFDFFSNVCEKNGTKCISARGKSNIFQQLTKQTDENILVVADGAAFGSEMQKVAQLLKEHTNIALYLPESFEWVILSSEIFNDKETGQILECPYDYIESGDYLSWERFFTYLLVQKTRKSYLEYSKRTLNPVYLNSNMASKILHVMDKITFQ